METNANVKKIQYNFETLNVKVSDFNTYYIRSGIFWWKHCWYRPIKILIQNLEKKVYEKFKLEEAKIKKDGEDLLKFKSEIINMKN